MVNGQRGLVFYYFLVVGYLYSWLFVFGVGILKFNEYYLGENIVENLSDFQVSSSVIFLIVIGLVLEYYIVSVWEVLGVEFYYLRVCVSSEIESEVGDIMDQ